jgi:flagellar hook-basal body complex protein FliE
MKVEGLDGPMGVASKLIEPAQRAGSLDFSQQLGELLRGADRDQKVAEQQARDLAAERGDVVETMVTLSKADLSLRTVVEVRNRALEAFHEIMRLQV